MKQRITISADLDRNILYGDTELSYQNENVDLVILSIPPLPNSSVYHQVSINGKNVPFKCYYSLEDNSLASEILNDKLDFREIYSKVISSTPSLMVIDNPNRESLQRVNVAFSYNLGKSPFQTYNWNIQPPFGNKRLYKCMFIGYASQDRWLSWFPTIPPSCNYGMMEFELNVKSLYPVISSLNCVNLSSLNQFIAHKTNLTSLINSASDQMDKDYESLLRNRNCCNDEGNEVAKLNEYVSNSSDLSVSENSGYSKDYSGMGIGKGLKSRYNLTGVEGSDQDSFINSKNQSGSQDTVNRISAGENSSKNSIENLAHDSESVDGEKILEDNVTMAKNQFSFSAEFSKITSKGVVKFKGFIYPHQLVIALGDFTMKSIKINWLRDIDDKINIGNDLNSQTSGISDVLVATLSGFDKLIDSTCLHLPVVLESCFMKQFKVFKNPLLPFFGHPPFQSLQLLFSPLAPDTCWHNLHPLATMPKGITKVTASAFEESINIAQYGTLGVSPRLLNDDIFTWSGLAILPLDAMFSLQDLSIDPLVIEKRILIARAVYQILTEPIQISPEMASKDYYLKLMLQEIFLDAYIGNDFGASEQSLIRWVKREYFALLTQLNGDFLPLSIPWDGTEMNFERLNPTILSANASISEISRNACVRLKCLLVPLVVETLFAECFFVPESFFTLRLLAFLSEQLQLIMNNKINDGVNSDIAGSLEGKCSFKNNYSSNRFWQRHLWSEIVICYINSWNAKPQNFSPENQLNPSLKYDQRSIENAIDHVQLFQLKESLLNLHKMHVSGTGCPHISLTFLLHLQRKGTAMDYFTFHLDQSPLEPPTKSGLPTLYHANNKDDHHTANNINSAYNSNMQSININSPDAYASQDCPSPTSSDGSPIPISLCDPVDLVGRDGNFTLGFGYLGQVASEFSVGGGSLWDHIDLAREKYNLSAEDFASEIVDCSLFPRKIITDPFPVSGARFLGHSAYKSNQTGSGINAVSGDYGKIWPMNLTVDIFEDDGIRREVLGVGKTDMLPKTFQLNPRAERGRKKVALKNRDDDSPYKKLPFIGFSSETDGKLVEWMRQYVTTKLHPEYRQLDNRSLVAKVCSKSKLPVLWTKVDPHFGIIGRIRRCQSPSMWEQQLLADNDPVGQMEAVVHLGRIGDLGGCVAAIGAVKSLIAAMSQHLWHPAVRGRAAYSLAQIYNAFSRWKRHIISKSKPEDAESSMSSFPADTPVTSGGVDAENGLLQQHSAQVKQSGAFTSGMGGQFAAPPDETGNGEGSNELDDELDLEDEFEPAEPVNVSVATAATTTTLLSQVEHVLRLVTRGLSNYLLLHHVLQADDGVEHPARAPAPPHARANEHAFVYYGSQRTMAQAAANIAATGPGAGQGYSGYSMVYSGLGGRAADYGCGMSGPGPTLKTSQISMDNCKWPTECRFLTCFVKALCLMRDFKNQTPQEVLIILAHFLDATANYITSPSYPVLATHLISAIESLKINYQELDESAGPACGDADNSNLSPSILSKRIAHLLRLDGLPQASRDCNLLSRTYLASLPCTHSNESDGPGYTQSAPVVGFDAIEDNLLGFIPLQEQSSPNPSFTNAALKALVKIVLQGKAVCYLTDTIDFGTGGDHQGTDVVPDFGLDRKLKILWTNKSEEKRIKRLGMGFLSSLHLLLFLESHMDNWECCQPFKLLLDISFELYLFSPHIYATFPFHLDPNHAMEKLKAWKLKAWERSGVRVHPNVKNCAEKYNGQMQVDSTAIYPESDQFVDEPQREKLKYLQLEFIEDKNIETRFKKFDVSGDKITFLGWSNQNESCWDIFLCLLKGILLSKALSKDHDFSHLVALYEFFFGRQGNVEKGQLMNSIWVFLRRYGKSYTNSPLLVNSDSIPSDWQQVALMATKALCEQHDFYIPWVQIQSKLINRIYKIPMEFKSDIATSARNFKNDPKTTEFEKNFDAMWPIIIAAFKKGVKNHKVN